MTDDFTVLGTYRMTADLRFGSIHDLILRKNTIVSFDGEILITPEGKSFTVPTLNKAVERGLLVPVSDTQAEYVPQNSFTTISAADGSDKRVVMATTRQEEERVVRPVDLDPEDAERINQSRIREALDKPFVKYSGHAGNRHEQLESVTVAGNTKFPKVSYEGDVGVTIRTIRASHESAVVGNPGEALRNAQRGVTSQASKMDIPHVATRTGVVALEPENRRAEPVRAAPTPVSNPYRVEDPVGEVVSNWDMKRPWQHRVAEAVDFYAGSPDILEALYKIETKGVVQKIKEKVSG